jgi:hypothetical protein
MKKIKISTESKIKGKTDWGKLKQLADEEIERSSKEDTDSVPPSAMMRKQYTKPNSGIPGFHSA